MQRGIRLASFLTASAVLGVSLVAHAEQALDRAAVEKIIHEYLMANPQVMVDSVKKMQADQQKKALEDQAKALKDSQSELVANALDPVGGNPKGDVTIVEFFDYNCGYCKKSQVPVAALLKEDKNLRVVFKEYPILVPESVTAAKMALAVHQLYPDRYFEFHSALMSHQGKVTDDIIDKSATELGLDSKKLREKIADPSIEKQISDVHALAARIGVAGTPAFFIGEELIPAALDLAVLKQKVAAVRSGGKEVAAH